jgi:hypothetical protein
MITGAGPPTEEPAPKGRLSQDHQAAAKPLDAGASVTADGGEVVDPAVENVSVQLRRRRAASWRLPPLADGRRDPIDPPMVTDQDRAILRYVWRTLARHGLLTAGMKAELSRVASSYREVA